MTSDEMKAAIERTKRYECCSLAEYDTVMALAEIGRLAVEAHKVPFKWGEANDKVQARNDAADAFLAKHGGGA